MTKNHITLPAFHSLITPYVLVYGTLRKGAGNWHRALRETAEHVGTFTLNGWALHHSISIGYTGREEDNAVVDLFKIIPTTRQAVMNIHDGLDALESIHSSYGYKCTIMPIIHPDTGEKNLAKLYYGADSDPSTDTANEVSYNRGESASEFQTLETFNIYELYNENSSSPQYATIGEFFEESD